MEKEALKEIIEEFTQAVEVMKLKYEKYAAQVIESLNDTHG